MIGSFNKHNIHTALFYLIIAICTGIFLYIAFNSKGFLEYGDGISHYQITKSSWEYPELFLHHWGKPLYILLASPFAQFGYVGMIVFNIVLFVVTNYFLFKTARKLNLDNGYILPVLCAFQPVYFNMVLAGMTEILFATLVSVMVYLFVSKRYLLGAIIISFSIVSRPEAQVVIPLAGAYLLFKKQYKPIPYLASGFLLYSIIGTFHYGDFFWLFTESKYVGSSIYGSGDFWHFFNSYDLIFGKWVYYLAIGGILYMGYLFVTKKQTDWLSVLLFLIIPLAVLLVHSYLWFAGIKGSLGLLRVIATVSPCVALLALYCIKWITKEIDYVKVEYLKYVAVIGLGLIIVNKPFSQRPYPIPQDRISFLIDEAIGWYHDQNFKPGKISYLHPYIEFKLGVDPYGKNVVRIWSLDREDLTNGLSEGDMIVWDGHFGPNEGGQPFDKIYNNPSIEFINAFYPEKRINVLGDNDFEIYFLKILKSKQDRIVEHKVVAKNLDTTFIAEHEFPYEFKKSLSEINNQGIARVKLSFDFESDIPERLTFCATLSDGEKLHSYKDYYINTSELHQQGKNHYEENNFCSCKTRNSK